MRRLSFLALACFVFVSSGTAPSWSQDDGSDRALCFSLGSENYKQSDLLSFGLAACSRMINSGKHKAKDLAAIYRARADWKKKMGKPDDALADHNISIGIEPNNVESYDYRADVYMMQGDLDKALADYNTATRINPNYVAAYYSRGTIYENKGEIDEARAEYNKAIALPTVDRIAQWAQDNARVRLKALQENSKK